MCVHMRTALVVVDIECNGERSWVNKPPFWTTVSKLVEYSTHVGLLDWGSFFFFEQTLNVDVAA